MRGALLLALLATSGCSGGGGHDLFVDVKTDLVPGLEFTEIRTELSATRPGSMPTERLTVVPREVVRQMSADDRFVRGVRAAAFRGVRRGEQWVLVSVYDAAGRLVSSRPTLLDVRGEAGLTVLLTRDCVGVECPGAGPPELLACLAGMCVDPRCHPATPEFCPAPRCVDVGACEAALADCAAPACEEGVCLAREGPGACGDGEWCHPEVGCTPLTPVADAGPPAPVDAGAMDAGSCERLECDTGDPCELGLTGCPDLGECEAVGFRPAGTPCPGGSCDGAGACG